MRSELRDAVEWERLATAWFAELEELLGCPVPPEAMRQFPYGTYLERYVGHVVDRRWLAEWIEAQGGSYADYPSEGTRRWYAEVALEDGTVRAGRLTVNGWLQHIRRLQRELADPHCPHCGGSVAYGPNDLLICGSCGAIGHGLESSLYSVLQADVRHPKHAWTVLRALREGGLREGPGETWWYRDPHGGNSGDAPVLTRVEGPDRAGGVRTLPVRIDPYDKLMPQQVEGLCAETDQTRFTEQVRGLGRGAGAVLMPKCDNCRYCVGLPSSEWADEARLERHCSWPLPADTVSVLQPDMRLPEAQFALQYDLTAIAAKHLVNIDQASAQPAGRMTAPGELPLMPVCGRYEPARHDWRGRAIGGVDHPSLQLVLETGEQRIQPRRRSYREPAIDHGELLDRLWSEAEATEGGMSVMAGRISKRTKETRERLLDIITRATPAEWRVQAGFADLLDRLGVYEATDEALAWMTRRLQEGARKELADAATPRGKVVSLGKSG